MVVGLPNYLYTEAVITGAQAYKSLLCKPLGQTATEATEMLDIFEPEGILHGYVEDKVYTYDADIIGGDQGRRFGQHPLGALALDLSRPSRRPFWGQVTCQRGCHRRHGAASVSIHPQFLWAEIRPAEMICWVETLVHRIEVKDHDIGLIL